MMDIPLGMTRDPGELKPSEVNGNTDHHGSTRIARSTPFCPVGFGGKHHLTFFYLQQMDHCRKLSPPLISQCYFTNLTGHEHLEK